MSPVDLRPRLRKKPKPPVRPPRLERYNRTDKFEKKLARLEVRKPELVARHRELRERFKAMLTEADSGRPIYGPPVLQVNQRWVLAKFKTNPDIAISEFFRITFNQHAPSVLWTP